MKSVNRAPQGKLTLLHNLCTATLPLQMLVTFDCPCYVHCLGEVFGYISQRISKKRTHQYSASLTTQMPRQTETQSWCVSAYQSELVGKLLSLTLEQRVHRTDSKSFSPIREHVHVWGSMLNTQSSLVRLLWL